MQAVASSEIYRGAKKIVLVLLFCTIGVAVNYAGSQLASLLHLPLFLDTIGTMVATMIGGSIPGVIVGYATNLVNTAIDPVSLYYGSVSVLIAVAIRYFWTHDWFKDPRKVVLAIVILALIGGGLSSIITSWLFGFGFSGGISTPFAEWLFSCGLANEFLAQFVADFVYDLADKSIALLVSLAVARAVPASVAHQFECQFWHQRPLSPEEKKAVSAAKLRKRSVRTKMMAVILGVVIIVGVVTTGISYKMFSDASFEESEKTAASVVELAAHEVDPNKVNTYLREGDGAEGYAEIESELARIRDSFPEVQYVYVYQIREDGCHVVLDPDTADEPGSEPGEVLDFDNAFADKLDALLAGEEIEPVISDEEWGWLLSIYKPLFDDEGTCVAYVAVDMSMDHVKEDGRIFLGKTLALFLAFLVLIWVVAFWYARYSLVLPINSISWATNGIAFDTEVMREDAVEHIRRLDIHTGDEVENLFRAVVKTTEDMVRYVDDAAEQAEVIERMQSSLIWVMADLVESRDKYTGDHVRKTAEYCKLIMEQMREDGMYADELTDEFVSNVYKSAPLHDIGKIMVSDTILNKPGRLTAEEFAVMKSHTTAGREILERAVDAVSEPSYLDEAKRLAEFHHERWDGRGYPSGRAGADIPLSARIMAVADVFDALVSKRSYKDGMPLEKAFSIIREGQGTQFDPDVAQAFLHAEDKARAIAAEHGDANGAQAFDLRDKASE